MSVRSENAHVFASVPTGHSTPTSPEDPQVDSYFIPASASDSALPADKNLAEPQSAAAPAAPLAAALQPASGPAIPLAGGPAEAASIAPLAGGPHLATPLAGAPQPASGPAIPLAGSSATPLAGAPQPASGSAIPPAGAPATPQPAARATVQVGAPGGHKSTQRVLAVIDLLASSESGLTMAQISRALGIPKGTLSPILKTMALEGFLEFHESTAEFTLGLKTYLAGKAFERRGGELALIQTVMERVVERCGETCQLASMDGADALYLAKAESPAPVQLVTDVGTRMPLYCTAVGKALLSRLSPEDLAQRLPAQFEPRTANTVRDRAALTAQLDQVRARGYAQEVGEVLPDVECFAVPVPAIGPVRYGLGVSTPRYRMDENHRARILAALRQAQTELSQRLT